MNRTITLITFLLLVGCTDPTPPNTTLITNTPQQIQTVETRFVVARISIFGDTLAYGGKRGVYVITDTKTGKEYIGVSGIGISELGSHTLYGGKTAATVQDEQ